MGYLEYALKRLLLVVPVVFGVSVIAFTLVRIVPGGPVESALGTQATEELVAQLRRENGLNRPIYIQYIDWITNVARGDFGTSIRTGRSVNKAISTSIAPTVWLALSATLVSLFIGIPAGIISAVNHYSTTDYVATFFAFIGLSIPNFFLGLILILIFSLHLDLFPASGFVSPLADPVAGIHSLILPAITLGTAISAVVMRMMRSSLLEVFSEEYITSARAKGLSKELVTNKHAVKNALIPTITVIGLNFGYLLGGTVIVEQIFTIPGMGQLVVTAIQTREYFVIQTTVLLIAVSFSIVNLTTDLIYAYLDPRIKYD